MVNTTDSLGSLRFLSESNFWAIVFSKMFVIFTVLHYSLVIFFFGNVMVYNSKKKLLQFIGQKFIGLTSW